MRVAHTLKRPVRRLGRASITTQVRLLVVLLLVLIPSLALSALLTARSGQRTTAELTLALGPGFQYNNEVLLGMTEAQAAWHQAVGAGAGRSVDAGEGVDTGAGTATGTGATAYRSMEPRVQSTLDRAAAALSRPELRESQRQQFAPLIRAQRAAVRAWFDAAEASEAARQKQPAVREAAAAGAARAYADFRASNRELDAVVSAQRSSARTSTRGSLGVVVSVVSIGALIAVLVVVVGGVLIGRTVTGPLRRLREVVTRQSGGDDRAVADVKSGAAEVRALAADYNALTDANRRLQGEQAETLLVHRLALDVARRVRGVPDIDAALHMVCASLGEGLGVDRVLLYTLADDGEVAGSAQFHRYDLPPLPPLPPSLMGQVAAVNDELRRDATVFRVPDLLDRQLRDDSRGAAFHRATGARALLMVPIGVGERGLGVLALMTVELPRHWRGFEIQGVQQCVGYIAQAIVSARLAEMREEQLGRLRELDGQKNDFMATVSHELRTPLTSISGYLELLEDGDYGELTGPQRSALAVIGRNTTRLRGLIEDLLVLNRIETAGLHGQSDDLPVDDILHAVVEVLRPTAAAGQVELMSCPVEEGLCVHVDRTQLERALINLGSNAVKFTPPGGQVRISAEQVGERVSISVADTGIGIPDEDLDQLGSRFFRASNATAKAIPGTGLGLAIVRTIVEGHGGEMFVASGEGEGTTVRLFLPSARQTASRRGVSPTP